MILHPVTGSLSQQHGSSFLSTRTAASRCRSKSRAEKGCQRGSACHGDRHPSDLGRRKVYFSAFLPRTAKALHDPSCQAQEIKSCTGCHREVCFQKVCSEAAVTSLSGHSSAKQLWRGAASTALPSLPSLNSRLSSWLGQRLTTSVTCSAFL